MRAIVIDRFGGPEVLKLVEIPDPTPGAGEVLIEVAVTGVNFADVMVRRGGYGRGDLPPLTPGIDCVGRIVALGEGVTGFRNGQRVAAFAKTGTYAERAVARVELVYALPDQITDESASALVMLVTAYNVLTLAGRMNPGETILVHAGAGGVGSLAIQLARHLGADKIVATVGSAAKLASARQFGADFVINYRDQELGASLQSALDGRGVDVVLDSVVGAIFEGGFNQLAPFGRYVVYGASSGEPATIPTNVLHQSNRAVIGYSTGTYRKLRPEALRPSVDAMFSHLVQGDVHVHVGGRFTLDQASEAHAFVEGRESIGKVLINVV